MCSCIELYQGLLRYTTSRQIMTLRTNMFSLFHHCAIKEHIIWVMWQDLALPELWRFFCKGLWQFCLNLGSALSLLASDKWQIPNLKGFWRRLYAWSKLCVQLCRILCSCSEITTSLWRTWLSCIKARPEHRWWLWMIMNDQLEKKLESCAWTQLIRWLFAG